MSTDNFTLSEVKLLVHILTTKYKLKVSIVKTGIINQYGIYIPKSNLHILVPIVSPFMHPYFLYKLNNLGLKKIKNKIYNNLPSFISRRDRKLLS